MNRYKLKMHGKVREGSPRRYLTQYTSGSVLANGGRSPGITKYGRGAHLGSVWLPNLNWYI
jgi:hypothetical protein